MPTINQLIRKPRKKAAKKSKSPALGSIVNTLKTKRYEKAAPLNPTVARLGKSRLKSCFRFWG